MIPHERAMERRQFLKGTLGAASLVALAGCDNLSQSSWFPSILNKAEKLTERVQRAVTPPNALAKEYGEADISKVFPANGNTDPGTEEYAEHVAKNFSEWTVEVVGLVQIPMSWSLAAMKELPSRTQITRHDCVEGWSAIGKWTGVPLGDLLRQVHAVAECQIRGLSLRRCGRRRDTVLREHGPGRLLSSTNDPGLRIKRHSAGHPPWRADSTPL